MRHYVLMEKTKVVKKAVADFRRINSGEFPCVE